MARYSKKTEFSPLSLRGDWREFCKRIQIFLKKLLPKGVRKNIISPSL